MRNKKDIIYNTLISEKIDICALQEVEIPHGYEHKLLSSRDYQIEVEKANGKARTAIAIKKTIDYIRNRNGCDKKLNRPVSKNKARVKPAPREKAPFI